jgi:flavodoxin
MNAVVVYESMQGNTRAVAEAIADGLGGASAVPVHQAAAFDTRLDKLERARAWGERLSGGSEN